MNVVTLDSNGFDKACRQLQTKVQAAFAPDVVIGIATGGVEVASRMFVDVPHQQVTARRPTTAAKERHGRIMGIVRAMPLWMRDALRMAEARWLALGNRGAGPREVDTSGLDVADAGRILVVDDAVDSGATLRDVLDAVRRAAGHADIRTAAITVTTDRPVAAPDYTLFNNRTLIRFPWSKDNRHGK